MRLKLSLHVLMLAALMSALVAACRSDSGGPPRNAAVVNVVANTSLTQWLQDAAFQFNRAGIKTSSGKPAYADVKFVEAGQAVLDMTASGATLPALWIPDSEVWSGVLAKQGITDFQGNCQTVANSPLVIAMWRPIAEALGWPGRSLGWLDIGTLAADPSSWTYYSGGEFGPTLRMGHTHPGLSGSGASTLLAVVHAARSQTDAVTVDEINEPIVQASVAAFEGTVAWFSPSTERLGQIMRERGMQNLGAAVVYESTVVNYSKGDPSIVAIYPFEGTFMATHPACVNGAANEEAQEAARMFRDHLLATEAQESALSHGLRPVDGSITVAAPLDAEHGVDPAQPKVLFNPPSADTVYAAGELWQAARKDVNLVMLLDVSGSMRGDKIENVRQAAVQFVRQMGDEDYLTLIAFSDRPRVLIEHGQVKAVREDAVRHIEDIEARGNTSLYDAIGEGADLIQRTSSPDTTNAMVVLSDGQDTSSRQFFFGESLINAAADNNTTVFTIAYGDDADRDVLRQLASRGQGNFYLGNEANIGSIYQEMSAAFGGSAGIGR